MISGTTRLIAHIGFPTDTFKSPMIYNPWFDAQGIDAVVVPMGCRAEDYAAFLQLVFRLSNIHGALITMPHKVATLGLADRVSVTARIAGAAGMDAALVTRLLASDADRDEVAARERHARDRGVNSVPTFIVANRHAISGAQPASLWRQVIEDLTKPN